MRRYVCERTWFNPPDVPQAIDPQAGRAGGDRPGAAPYLFDEEIVLAVNVARAAGRALLVSGEPGTGKSALARGIADNVGAGPPIKEVITERTEARDLKWRFDAVRRLRDASTGGDLAVGEYIVRGVLWKAFAASHKAKPVVVLIDEIDKADPDVPNGLLDAFGDGTFDVDELKERDGTPFTVTRNPDNPPFVVITTNDERALPAAFVRRCVTLTLDPPSNDRLLQIAKAWGMADDDKAKELADAIADGKGRSLLDGSRAPNAAEYLDALRAWRELEYSLGSEAWNAVVRLTLTKLSAGGRAGER